MRDRYTDVVVFSLLIAWLLFCGIVALGIVRGDISSDPEEVGELSDDSNDGDTGFMFLQATQQW